MTDFKSLFVNLTLFALVVFAIMSFAIITENQNDSPVKITDNEIVNETYGDLFVDLGKNNLQSDAQNASEAFGEVTPTQNVGELGGTAIVSPTKIFKSVSFGAYNILIALPMKILGVPPIVASVISGIFILLLLIGIWAIWKGAISK